MQSVEGRSANIMATEDSNKRRRVIAGNENSSGLRKIYDLPIEPLTYVADFLPLPSRAMFAAALFNGKGGLSTENNQKIAGNACETLDFGDIEKDLAAKLSDDDVDAILRCVDAVNKLKILRLTNCVNISGAGLEPLRGSEIIEIIDFSFVGAKADQYLHPDPPISCERILPILDTIIIGAGALKHLQFPLHWRNYRSEDSDFYQFLERFNRMLDDRGLNRCFKCNEIGEPPVELNNSRHDYGIQCDTCSVCLKHHCYGCSDNNDDGSYTYFCKKCERVYCSDCSVKYTCERCDTCYCVECPTRMRCAECEVNLCDFCGCLCPNCRRPYCDDCHDENKCECDVCQSEVCRECTRYLECEDCHFGHCEDCCEKAGINGVHSCQDCGIEQCVECRLRRPYPVDRSCSGCFNIIAKPWLGERPHAS